MSSLDSTSTLTEVRDAYFDNASYEEDASVSKAKTFVTACRQLLVRQPSRSTKGGRGGEEIEINLTVVQEQLTEAQRWIAEHDTSVAAGGPGTFKHADFRNFRD